MLEILHDVTDEDTFLMFLKALANDKFAEDEMEKINPSPSYSSGAKGWENNSISDFLDAAVACATDGADSTNRLGQNNPWKRAAAIIYGGKIYE